MEDNYANADGAGLGSPITVAASELMAGDTIISVVPEKRQGKALIISLEHRPSGYPILTVLTNNNQRIIYNTADDPTSRYVVLR